MYKLHIQRVLDYIELHLKDDRPGVLDNSTLAQIAGYSEYHFLRVFRDTVHLTPADYIRKRRISEIVRRIGDSKRPISDIAFEYGFNSKENFTRAFKSEHHILPTEFRISKCSLKLFEKFEFDTVTIRPSVSLCFLEDFVLIAYPCDEEKPPNFWNKYNSEKRSEKLSGGSVTEDFGAMIWNSKKKSLDYYIGLRDEDANGDRTGTVQLEIKGGLYAVFDTPKATQHNFVNIIHRTWDYISREWLPSSGYIRAKDRFELESYVESSREYSERIYIPLTEGDF